VIRRLVGTLVALVLIAAGLDYGLRVWAGFWLGDRVQEALHLSKRPSVSFGGLLFTPQVARGHIDSATLEEDAFKVHGVAFTHARLTLDDVKFQTGKLLLHHRGVVTATSGGGVLAMTGADLARAFKREGQDVSVTVARGHIRVSGGGLPQAVRAEAAVQNGALVVRSAGSRAALRLALPPLGRGIAYGHVSVVGDQAELDVTVRNARLRALVGS